MFSEQLFSEQENVTMERIANKYRIPKKFLVGCCQYFIFTKDSYEDIMFLNGLAHGVSTAKIKKIIWEKEVVSFFEEFSKYRNTYTPERFYQKKEVCNGVG